MSFPKFAQPVQYGGGSSAQSSALSPLEQLHCNCGERMPPRRYLLKCAADVKQHTTRMALERAFDMSHSLQWAAEYWLSSGVLSEHVALLCVCQSPTGAAHKRCGERCQA